MHHKNELKMEATTFDDLDTHSKRKMAKYSLRQRRQTTRDKTKFDQLVPVASNQSNEKRKSQEKSKPKAAPLSKYRRKTANARERTRMREINSAFENLRKCVPLSISNGSPTSASEKLTKITTLRLAMKYIRTLNEVLSKPMSDLNFQLNNNNYHSGNNNSNERLQPTTDIPKRVTHKCQLNDRSKYYKRKLKYSPCLTPPMDSPIDMGLVLESDGESVYLSEPCLSPLSQNMKPFNCVARGSMDLGLLLESDSDSLQLSEPCLSALGGIASLNPFGDLLTTGFAEHSSLDIYLS